MNAQANVPYAYPIPINEDERLRALDSYDILDSEPEQRFDDLTELVSCICDTPIALVSLVDEKRQWFKSRVGVDVSETPREWAFCAYAITQPDDIMVVPNALEDPRFVNNPLVTDKPNIRFYAGAPLVSSDGYALGTLCVIDAKPRYLTEPQLSALSAGRRQVLAQLELSRNLIQLNQANFKLIQLNQAQNEFLHMAAHDLRNPLSVISDYAQTLLNNERPLTNETLYEIATQIQQSSHHMHNLVANLVDVNSISAGQSELKLEPTALTPIFERLQYNYQKRARAKHIKLYVKQLVKSNVLATNATLMQALDNLLSNAIKYSPPNTEVMLYSEDAFSHVKICIKDQGPGFSDSDQQHMFKKFKRLSAHPTGGEHASGLGLYTAKLLLDAMHAEIYCDSKLGEGTTFTIELAKARN